METSFAAAGLTVALLAALACARALRWWRRRGDRDALVALFASLHVALLGGALSALLARLDLSAHVLAVAAAYAWLGFLAWRSTRFVLPPDAPAGPGGARLVLRATAAGAASGLLALLGLAAALLLQDGLEGFAFLAIFGSVPALLLGAAFGLALGLVDAALLPRLRRAAR